MNTNGKGVGIKTLGVEFKTTHTGFKYRDDWDGKFPTTLDTETMRMNIGCRLDIGDVKIFDVLNKRCIFGFKYAEGPVRDGYLIESDEPGVYDYMFRTFVRSSVVWDKDGQKT